jgi:hypothetical protein
VADKQLIDLPASDSTYTYEQLGYLQARDAVLSCEYAFLAYKETERSGGAWRVRIRSSQTAGAVFEPDAMAKQALVASDQGKSHFIWGYNFEPSEGDPRQIEFRVHVADGKPKEIEMLARMRKGDHSAGDAKSVRFAWPA